MVKSLPAMWETRFDPWIGKILWRRQWHPTPVLLPGESNGWRSLAVYSPWGTKSQTIVSMKRSDLREGLYALTITQIKGALKEQVKAAAATERFRMQYEGFLMEKAGPTATAAAFATADAATSAGPAAVLLALATQDHSKPDDTAAGALLLRLRVLKTAQTQLMNIFHSQGRAKIDSFVSDNKTAAVAAAAAAVATATAVQQEQQQQQQQQK